MGIFDESSSSESEKEKKDDDEVEDDPLDAYMTGITEKVAAAEEESRKRVLAEGENAGMGEQDSNKKRREDRGGRLDLENEEEATSHWKNVSVTSHWENIASKSEGVAEDSVLQGKSLASKSLARCFRRAGESATASIDKEQEEEFDEEDIKKKKSEAIEPLAPKDHSSVQYEGFRRRFYVGRSTERGKKWREENSVSCEAGQDPVLHFEELSADKAGSEQGHDPIFPPSLLKTINKCGYSRPTAVQAQAMPCILSGRDVLVTASTGSGKTLAFVWPLVVHCCDQRHIQPGLDGPIGLILSPTRELASQTYTHAKTMFTALGGTVLPVTGGMPNYQNIKLLKAGAEALVATPGRLIHMLKSKATNLHRVTMLILDEADRMLEMGFIPQVQSIIHNIRPDAHKLMFSATFQTRIAKLAQSFLHNPIRVAVGKTNASTHHVDQNILVLPNHHAKLTWLISMIPTFALIGRTIVFVATKADADAIAYTLQSHPTIDPQTIASIHGDKHQSDRRAALSKLQKGKLSTLIATDVAARGLHIDDIATVINFHPPKNMDMHVHRIGRTGRIASTTGEFGRGSAYTLLMPQNSDFANLLLEAFQRENRLVSDELMDLAKKSKYFGRTSATKQCYGIGYHSNDFS